MFAPFTYSTREVLVAPAKALTAKQITVMTLFVALALILYDLGLYLALAYEGAPASGLLQSYGLLPMFIPRFDSLIAQGLFGLGVFVGVFTLMVGFFAVSASQIEAIRGNHFMSAGQMVRFALRRTPQLLFAELAIIGLVLVIVGLFALLGLVSRVPAVGPWLYSVLFALPNFIIAMLTIFVIFVLTLTVFLTPAVAAADRTTESFGVIVETFSTILRQPVRWFGYTLYALVTAKLASWVYAYFAYRAVQFMVWSSGLGGGNEVYRTVSAGLSHLPIRSEPVRFLTTLFPGSSIGFSVPIGSPLLRDLAVGYLMAAMLFIILLSVVGYFFAVCAVAQARAFAVIRFAKDNYRLSDEKALFFEDEHVNPPIDTQQPASQ